MSVLDTFNRPLGDLRISLIDRCNFRCPYCMPSDKFHHIYQFFDKKDWLSFEEIARLAKIFVGLGVTKLRLTGGEPLLRPDLDRLVAQLAHIKGVEDLALTTNGSMLKEWAPRLRNAGLGRLTVSLDTLDEAVFHRMSGMRGSVKKVLEGMRAAYAAGFTSLKINAVVQRGVNDHTILDLVKYFHSTPHSIRFIEYMDVGNQNRWDMARVVPSEEIVSLINAHFPLEPLVDDAQGADTAEIYHFKDGLGEIGFISSITKPFCGFCDRLRLSADGKIYTCLFACDGTDLKRYLRDGIDDVSLESIIRKVWMDRQDRYSEIRSQMRHTPCASPKIEMYQIGG